MIKDRDTRQREVGEWVLRTFGSGAQEPSERISRLIEEVAELAQVEEFPLGIFGSIVEHVYSRPPGDAEQEVGGVGVTLLAYCQSRGYSADAAEEREVARVLKVDPDHFRERQNVKHKAGVGIAAGRVEGVLGYDEDAYDD